MVWTLIKEQQTRASVCRKHAEHEAPVFLCVSAGSFPLQALICYRAMSQPCGENKEQEINDRIQAAALLCRALRDFQPLKRLLKRDR